MLKDIDPKYALPAVVELCGSGEWPPSIAQIRKAAYNLSRGHVSPPSAWEAWERATAGTPGGDIETRAINLIGGAWAIKHSENPEVMRAQFLKCYSELLEKHDREACAIKAVKQAAELNAPLKPERLFPPPENQYPDRDPGFTPCTPEMAREMMKGLLSPAEAAVLREVKLV
jgi:hypothetical protein